MENSRTRNSFLNIGFSLLLQVFIFIKGLIVPRLIITNYGSDVNGLISSITQFLAYISLLEGGVGGVFRTSLYKPLAEGDSERVSGIVRAQKLFYRKLGLFFVFYVILMCAVYPLFAKTQMARNYIISFILILSIGTFVEYFVSLPYASLLSADQKIRINHIVCILYNCAMIGTTVFWVYFKADVRLIYLTICLIGILRPVFYSLYVKKHYKLSKTAKPESSALNQRFSGMVHHIAFYIHSNTDSAILTVLISTAAVSVYNMYGAITFGVGHIANSISSGIAAGLGNLMMSGDIKSVNKTVNMFEIAQAGTATVLYTASALMLIPFIKLYTSGMTDINYVQPAFGYVFIAAEAIYCFRCIYSTVSINAAKYKETQKGAILECTANLLISLFLVGVVKCGIIGVAIGTVVAMIVRCVFEVCFLSKNVLYRKKRYAAKIFLVSGLLSAISIILCKLIFNYANIDSYLKWILYAIPSGIITLVICACGYFVFYPDTTKAIVYKLLGRKERVKPHE